MREQNLSPNKFPCASNPELFFTSGEEAAAIEICNTCDARSECLEGALDNEELYGVWGGKTAAQRKLLVAERKRQGVSRRIGGSVMDMRHWL